MGNRNAHDFPGWLGGRCVVADTSGYPRVRARLLYVLQTGPISLQGVAGVVTLI